MLVGRCNFQEISLHLALPDKTMLTFQKGYRYMAH